MRFKILAVVIILCLVVSGCVEEKRILPSATPTENKELKEKQVTPATTSTIVTPVITPQPITTITATPRTITTEKSETTKVVKNQIQNNYLQYELETPSDTEYEWIDLNESLSIVNITGTTYKTGLLGKMYVPKEILPNREYPIYILLSRSSEASELATVGVTLCVSPSFFIDLPNKKIDLYIHLGVGGVFLGNYYWDKLTKHWFIRNIYSKSGFNLTCKIDDKLYAINLPELNPNEWQVYKIYLTVKTPKENPEMALEQSLKNELSPSESYSGGLWIPIQDNMGLWIEKIDNNTYLAELYMNKLTLRVCAPGLGFVFSIPPEMWIHAGFGINKWDKYLKHYKLLSASVSAEKPLESSWKRIEVFKVRFDKLKSYVSEIETIENGNFKGVATSNEKVVQWIYPTLYCVKVNGIITISNNYQKSINTTLYYTEKKDFKKGDKIVGFVKLVTIRTTKEPITYLDATGNGYWIDKQPKMIPILNISAPESAYVGEEVEISVYSNCYMIEGQPSVCTYTYNPIPNVTIKIVKDGTIIETGKTDENGIYKTTFSETGEYTITASKDGYISTTTKINVSKWSWNINITYPKELPIEQITVPQTTVSEERSIVPIS
ncbi:MAG: hypothetical protein DSY33_04550 [Archaeoglobus sp.]|nr:MAG: hypothetical protein DSY33_04550 [Archaeoglobus sp.]